MKITDKILKSLQKEREENLKLTSNFPPKLCLFLDERTELLAECRLLVPAFSLWRRTTVIKPGLTISSGHGVGGTATFAGMQLATINPNIPSVIQEQLRGMGFFARLEYIEKYASAIPLIAD